MPCQMNMLRYLITNNSHFIKERKLQQIFYWGYLQDEIVSLLTWAQTCVHLAQGDHVPTQGLSGGAHDSGGTSKEK